MILTGEYRLQAKREIVWQALNDPEILAASIPGCESLTQESPTIFNARLTIGIGPVRAKFGGRVELSDLDPPNGYRITGAGEGGVAGFAKGGAKIRLLEDGEGGTILSYEAEGEIGGKLAQIGQRLIDGAAHKLAGEFFAAFATALAARTADRPPDPVTPGTAEPAALPDQSAMAAGPQETSKVPPSLPPSLWIAGLVAILALGLWYFSVN